MWSCDAYHSPLDGIEEIEHHLDLCLVERDVLHSNNNRGHTARQGLECLRSKPLERDSYVRNQKQTALKGIQF